MNLPQKLLAKFTVFDLIIIAMMAALGIAIKPVVVPLAHIISGPLFIPSGAVAGGFYMLWLVLGAGLTGKRGTAALIAITQALVVTATGMVGSHGAMSLLTYSVPGIAADLGLLLIGHRACCSPCSFLAGMLANAGGTTMVNFVYFRLPLIPLVLTLSVAALSGGLGGIIAFQIRQRLLKYQDGIFLNS
ncbi:MAG: ECF transporter S component [Syntrophomonas sp.]